MRIQKEQRTKEVAEHPVNSASTEAIALGNGFLEKHALVRLPEAERLLGLKRSSIYLRLNKTSQYFDPDFPRPLKMGLRAIGWRVADLIAYQALRNQFSGPHDHTGAISKARRQGHRRYFNGLLGGAKRGTFSSV